MAKIPEGADAVALELKLFKELLNDFFHGWIYWFQGRAWGIWPESFVDTFFAFAIVLACFRGVFPKKLDRDQIEHELYG